MVIPGWHQLTVGKRIVKADHFGDVTEMVGMALFI